LLGVAKERQGLKVFCFLGEVPTYTMNIQNPMAAMAILKTLTKVLKLEIDMTELERYPEIPATH